MWLQTITIFSAIFCLAVFCIVLILHSFAFDPDTEDVPKHLRTLKTLAWLLTGLCIYYNAGETEGIFQVYLKNTIFVLACVLLVGLWYILELPKWYQQPLEEREREYKRDLNPKETNNSGCTERRITEQSNHDNELRRQSWKIQERERFSRIQQEASNGGSVGGADNKGEVDDVSRTGRSEGDLDEVEQEEKNSRSGLEAYQYLENRKYYEPRLDEILEFREVLWWVDSKDKTLRCLSDFTDRSLVCRSDVIPSFPSIILVDKTVSLSIGLTSTPKWDQIPPIDGSGSLARNSSTLFMTCVSVENPAHITPAVGLIRSILRRLHYYDKYFQETSRTQFRDSVAVGCQFKKYPADPGKTDDEDNNLVSCMTVCVDKILVVNFHITHMIEKGKDREDAIATVQGIGFLFESLIFNEDITKFWFNYQGDIKAMDATLDEIFRGTPRPTFRMNAFPEWLKWPNPFYKLTLSDGQAEAFGVARPGNLVFRGRNDSWGTECPYGFHINSIDVFGNPCPCRTRNLDLAVVTEFIIRDLHMEDPRSELVIRPWTEVRKQGTYAHFENCMLLGDKHEELLRLFRDTGIGKAHPLPVFPVACLNKCGDLVCDASCENHKAKEEHVMAIRRFGLNFSGNFNEPSFQSKPQLLGYAVGRVVGLALVARFLMTTENPRLLAERLRFWSFLPATGPKPTPKFGRPIAALGPNRLVHFKPEWDSRSKLVRYISLYVDHTAFAEEDLIGWDISGDQNIRKIIGISRRWKFITEDKRVLLDIAWRFLKTNPVLFGDFLYSYSSKPYRPVLRHVDDCGNIVSVDGNQLEERPRFSKETINAIFRRKPFRAIYKGFLPIIVAQLELVFLAQLIRDNDNTVQMVQQFDGCRRKYEAGFSQADKRRLLDARETLNKKHSGPVWKPKEITTMSRYSVSRWIFQPLQGFSVFPDRYNLGLRLLEGLVSEFRALATAGKERLEKAESQLIGLPGGRGSTLLKAAIEGVNLFPLSEFEWMWAHGANERRNIENRIEIFMGFWVNLFFETTTPKAIDSKTGEEYLAYNDEEDAVDGTRFAEKVYELTFSPTIFYMPDFGSLKPEPGTSDRKPEPERPKGSYRDPASAPGGPSEEGWGRGKSDGAILGGWDMEFGTEAIPVGWDVKSSDQREWWDVEKHSSKAQEPSPELLNPRDRQFKRLFNVWIDTVLGPASAENAFPE